MDKAISIVSQNIVNNPEDFDTPKKVESAISSIVDRFGRKISIAIEVETVR